MKKNYIAAFAVAASLAFPPMMAAAQTETASDAPITQDEKAAAAAAKKAAALDLKNARAALRAAKTEDASAADIDIVRAAADDGNTGAILSLASYLLPRDADAAVQLYDGLITQSNPQGMFGLASAYWSGAYIEKDRTKAEALIKEAVAAGDPAAMLTYAKWLPILDKTTGTEQALALLESNADVLDAAKVTPLASEFKLKGDLSFGMRDDVAEWIADVPAVKHDAIIFSTLSKDQNLYVWLMQDVMAKRGLYTGARNGLLTSSTARGFRALCADLGITADCVRGPLHRQSAKAAADALKAQEG